MLEEGPFLGNRVVWVVERRGGFLRLVGLRLGAAVAAFDVLLFGKGVVVAFYLGLDFCCIEATRRESRWR